MKYTFSFLLVLLLSVAAFAKPVKISGTLKNTGNAAKVYFFEFQGPSRVAMDSSALKNGAFSFEFKKPLPRGMYSIGLNPQKAFDIVGSAESFTVTADMDNLPQSVQITGSAENTMLLEFHKQNRLLGQ